MNSTSLGTRIRNNRKSMSNLTINKLLLPTNLKNREQNCNSNNQQNSDQVIEQNVFFIPKQTLRRIKYSDQNILTTNVIKKHITIFQFIIYYIYIINNDIFQLYNIFKIFFVLNCTSVTNKSLQSQFISKYLQESLQFRSQCSRKQIAIKELVSPSKPFIGKRKETLLNTEPSQEIQQQQLMPLLKSSIINDDQYKFTFYSPKTQDHKLRLPKEFQILPCSKKRYFI